MGRKREPLLLSIVPGDRAVGGALGRGAWKVTGQTQHREARGTLYPSPLGTSSVVGPSRLPAFLSLGSVPGPCHQHLLSEPAPGKHSHEIMGWGKLAGFSSSLEPWQVHGGARRPCNLPPGPISFQGGGFSKWLVLSGLPQSSGSNNSGTLARD